MEIAVGVYESSWKKGKAGLLLLLLMMMLGGLGSAAVLGVIYPYLVVTIPFI
jgi:hypothetical protein